MCRGNHQHGVLVKGGSSANKWPSQAWATSLRNGLNASSARPGNRQNVVSRKFQRVDSRHNKLWANLGHGVLVDSGAVSNTSTAI